MSRPTTLLRRAIVFGFFATGLAVLAPTVWAATDGLVAEWQLDSLSGGSTADSTTNGNNATASGVTVVPGQSGNAFNFTGDPAQSVKVPNSPSLEPAAVSVSAWVKSSGPGGSTYVVSKGANGCFAASYGMYTAGGLSFYISNASGSIALSPAAGGAIWNDAWHHVIGTFDGSAVRLFVDGTEVGTGTATSTKIGYNLPTGNDLYIGTYHGSCDLPFKGAIDDVQIYNKAIAVTGVTGSAPSTTTPSGPTTPATTTTAPLPHHAVVAADPHHRRSFLSAAVQSPNEISHNLGDLSRSVLITVALFGLILFPSQLFNSTLESNYDEIKGWLRRRRPALDGVRNVVHRRFWETWTGFGVFTVLSALLYGLLSPHLGFNLGSLNTLIAIAASIVVVTLLFAVPLRRYMKAHHGDRGHIKVAPGTLAIAAVCVLVSRAVGFQPGYVYGLIAGFAFAAKLTKQDEGHGVARAAVWMLGAAVAVWIVRIPIDSLAEKSGASTLVLLTDSVLAAIFVAGVESAVFGLMPLRFLSGEKLFAYNRRLWFACVGVGGFLFVHVLLDPNSGYLANTNSTPLKTIIGLFVGFAVVSVLFWGYFRFRKQSVTAGAAAADHAIVLPETEIPTQREPVVLPTVPPHVIRAWAMERGLDVKPQGPIPKAVREAYAEQSTVGA
jgi:hypothetical protein